MVNPDLVVGTIAAVSTAVSAVLVAKVQQTGRKVDAATVAAAQARDNTSDVAAGFAAQVTQDLATLKRRQVEDGNTLMYVRDALVRHFDEHVRGVAPDTVPIEISVRTTGRRADWESGHEA